MKNTIVLHILLTFVLLTIACQSDRKQTERTVEGLSEVNNGLSKEDLIELNRDKVKKENKRIDDWVKKQAFRYKSSATGLKYRIIENGKGPKARIMSQVSLIYTVKILEGDTCYASRSADTVRLTLGQSDYPSGLQEALLYLPEGSRSELIIPYYLAYGFSGDGDCIPGASTLQYFVQVLNVSESQ